MMKHLLSMRMLYCMSVAMMINNIAGAHALRETGRALLLTISLGLWLHYITREFAGADRSKTDD